MRLLVAGASGRTGRIFIERALEHGHDLTALVRKPPEFGLRHERLSVVCADVLEPASFSGVMAGQDAVVSMLAPRPRRNGRVYIEGTRNLTDAMVATGVRRIVVVSAEGAGVAAGSLPLAYRIVSHIPVVARLYPDIATMETDLAARSDLDWTIVRAAVLSDGPATGRYRTTVGDMVPDGLRISRADLAGFLLDVTESGVHVRERVAIAY